MSKLSDTIHKYLYEQSFKYPVDSSEIRWGMQECTKEVKTLMLELIGEVKQNNYPLCQEVMDELEKKVQDL